MLISATGSRFPRATLQLPRKQKPLPAGSSAGTGTAHCSSHQKALLLFPQDKEGFGSIYIARRKLVCIFEKSTALRSNQLVERFKSSFQVSKSKVTGC